MKRLLLPAILLVAILVIWMIQKKTETDKVRGKTIENFLELDTSLITRFEVASPDDKVALYKEDNRWYVENTLRVKPANHDIVSSVLDVATQINAGNIVSQNPERQLDFNVDDSTGTRIDFYYEDEVKGSIIVGKMDRRNTHTYVRKPESDKVYEAEGPVSMVFNRPPSNWLDHTILSVLSGSIKSIDISHANGHFKLIRQDTGWAVSESPFDRAEIADEVAVGSFISSLTNIQAFDFINASDSGLIDFDQWSLSLIIEQFDGSSNSLVFARANEDNSRIYVHRDDFEETFVIRKSRLDHYRKPLEYFLAR